VSQEAARAALEGAEADVARMVEAFSRRRDLVTGILAQADRIRLCPPAGAFYAFPDISGYFGCRNRGGRIESDVELVDYLLEEAHAAFVPGSGFGSPRHMRLSFACSEDEITQGLGATVEALNHLAR
jgi:aspartate aminotransferase